MEDEKKHKIKNKNQKEEQCNDSHRLYWLILRSRSGYIGNNKAISVYEEAAF
jgi:hypothetical protein